MEDNVAGEGLLTLQDAEWFSDSLFFKTAGYNWTVDSCSTGVALVFPPHARPPAHVRDAATPPSRRRRASGASFQCPWGQPKNLVVVATSLQFSLRKAFSNQDGVQQKAF